MQFGNEHGRYAVESRTAFLVYGSQYEQRVEAFYHDLCAAMRQAVHGGQYHTEAMEQRNTYSQLIIGRELHVLTG